MSVASHSPLTPRVSALEYTKDVVRACREAGMSPNYKHITTIQDKLFEETTLPRMRVLQILDRLQGARDGNAETVYLTIAEVNIILQAAREFK